MTPASNATSAYQRAASGTGRLIRAFRTLPHERRLAVYASLGLFVTMFLPWYQRQFFTVVSGKAVPAADTQTAWGAFSFVEAAVLLVAAGVLTLLFQRAEGRAFHVPGGDGGVITAAGFWTCALVVWRIFDKQGGQTAGANVISYGIEWGIFVALGVAILLTYAGTRIRAAHRPEPPLPGEGGAPEPAAPPSRPAQPRSAGPDALVRRPRPVPAEDPPTVPREPDDVATLPREPEDAATQRMPRHSSEAARVKRPALGDDDQLTIPFDDGS